MTETSADSPGIPDDVTGPQRTLLQMFKLFVEPELKRRLLSGALSASYEPKAVQVLFPEGKPPEVRLDKEVNFTVRAAAPRKFKDDEPISLSEIAPFVNATQLEVADANAGHFTAILLKDGGWLMFFDFRRNRLKGSKLVELAGQYCTAAADALQRQHYGPAIDNLFSACELAAKARLITSAGMNSTSKSHGQIRSGINLGSKLGNVDREFVDMFNQLSRDREAARYEPGKHELSTLIDNGMIAKARAEINELIDRLKQFGDRPENPGNLKKARSSI
jgi:hypothetical protein